jgi:hypothetical protein
MSKQLVVIALFCVLVPLVASLDGDTFTVNCQPLTIQRSDPILFPGKPGGHVHSIIGGTAFQRSMSGRGQDSDQTTCDKAIDHSNYWVPQLYHQRSDNKLFEMVKWTGSAVYYQKRACNYTTASKVCDKTQTPLAFPYGFRMIAGDTTRRTQNNNDFAQRAISMMCIFDGGSKEGNGLPPRHCNTIRAQVYFPSCWDGINLDSADHKSHVSYPEIGDYNGGVCPKTHPVALLSIFYEFFFDTSSYTDYNRFVFANGDTTGFGYHGDFVMGWTDRNLLQTAHRDCVGASDCPKLGNQPASKRPLMHPAIFEEEIGLNGPISSPLPGGNPVVFAN